MSGHITRLSGPDWENWANKLLACHYGPAEYQTVPDKDKGDAGIEGFTLSGGHAYQAYGCEEPISTTERYEKQRSKLSKDIKKFIDNKAILGKIFGGVKISRWVLFVPYYDSKEIVKHAAKKTDEVIAEQLPYVSQSFRVKICSEDDFPVARDQLINASASSVEVEADPATTDQIVDWAKSNSGLALVLDNKLKRLPTITSDEKRRDFHTKVLKWYLEGESILDALRKFPELYEKVIKTKSHREGLLAIAAVSGGSSQEILTSSVQELLSSLKNEVKGLHSFSSEKLAYGTVADWLLRCPLDFPEIAG